MGQNSSEFRVLSELSTPKGHCLKPIFFISPIPHFKNKPWIENSTQGLFFALTLTSHLQF